MIFVGTVDGLRRDLGSSKLLVDQAESYALAAYLDRLVGEEATLVSSMLLETELRRLAMRLDLDQTAVTDVLDRFHLYEPDRRGPPG